MWWAEPGRSSEIVPPDDPATPGWCIWTVPGLDGVQLWAVELLAALPARPLSTA